MRLELTDSALFRTIDVCVVDGRGVDSTRASAVQCSARRVWIKATYAGTKSNWPTVARCSGLELVVERWREAFTSNLEIESE